MSKLKKKSDRGMGKKEDVVLCGSTIREYMCVMCDSVLSIY